MRRLHRRLAGLLACLLLSACAAPTPSAAIPPSPDPAASRLVARDGYFELILTPPQVLGGSGLRVTALAVYTGQGTGEQGRGEVDMQWGNGEISEAARVSAAPTWPPCRDTPSAQDVAYGDFGLATPFSLSLLDAHGHLLAQGPVQQGVLQHHERLFPGDTLAAYADFDPLPPGDYRLRAVLVYRLSDAPYQSVGTHPPFDTFYVTAELPFALPGAHAHSAPRLEDRSFAVTLSPPEAQPDGSLLATAQATYTGRGVTRATGNPWPPMGPAQSQWISYGDFGESTPFALSILDRQGHLFSQGTPQQGNFGRFQRLIPGTALIGQERFAPLAAGEYWLRATLAYRLSEQEGMQAPFNTFHLTVDVPFTVP